MLRLVAASALSLFFVLGTAGVSTAAVPAQDDATTPTDGDTAVDGSSEDNPLLVPGPEAEGSTQVQDVDADAPADTDEAQVDDAVESGSTNDEAEDTVRMVMLALIGVAVALAALTIYYWWRTRPSRRASEPRRRRGVEIDDGDAGATDGVAGGTDPDATDADASDVDSAGTDSVVADPKDSGGPGTRGTDSAPASDDAGTVGAWQTDSTSTR